MNTVMHRELAPIQPFCRRLLYIAALAVTTGLACSRDRTPVLAGAWPTSIVLEIYPISSGSTSYQTTMTDRAGCARILQVLKEARAGEDHKCANAGLFTIRYGRGRTDTFHFMPVHDSAHFELRFGDEKFEVDRDKIFAALAEAGVDTTKFPASEH